MSAVCPSYVCFCLSHVYCQSVSCLLLPVTCLSVRLSASCLLLPSKCLLSVRLMCAFACHMSIVSLSHVCFCLSHVCLSVCPPHVSFCLLNVCCLSVLCVLLPVTCLLSVCLMSAFACHMSVCPSVRLMSPF